jgi:hypothetical protein
VVKKYYTAGSQRIALRSGGALYWLLNDHLGGTAHTISGTTETGEVRYRAFGVTRFASGITPTPYRFTGQREEAALGLYFYNTRWYDPALDSHRTARLHLDGRLRSLRVPMVQYAS